jgi:GAF domain-containing protein
MPGSDREVVLTQAFIGIVDKLVEEYDLLEVLSSVTEQCVEVFDVSGAGLLLVNAKGDLQVVASSNEAVRIVELFELQSKEGPCVDAYRKGNSVSHPDLTTAADRWPRFAPVAVAAGFQSVHAHAMRLRGQVIGALNLFSPDARATAANDIVIAQAIAHLSTIAIFHHRASREAKLVNEQLAYALDSRIVVEQAKGVLAERNELNLDDAFSQLRRYARHHNLLLVDVAKAVVEGRVRIESPVPGESL